MNLLLESALDVGISELDFWFMTQGEVKRAIASKNRVLQAEAKDKAMMDYIQANLIVKGVSICLGDHTPFPSLHEAYPGVFEDDTEERKEQIQQQKIELSTLRFKQFAQSYNNRFKNKEVPK